MFDFGLTNTGDLIFDEHKSDIYKSEGDGMRRQNAICRIKSVKGDFYNTKIGADLEQILGEDCSENLLNILENLIRRALVFDDYFDNDDIFIISKIEDNYISAIVFLNSIDEMGTPYSINVTIDIEGGFKISYDSY